MYYNVAGHTLEILTGELGNIPSFSCFISEPVLSDPLVVIRLNEAVFDEDATLLHQFTSENVSYKFLGDGRLYFLRVQSPVAGASWLMKIYPEGKSFVALTDMNEDTDADILRLAVWIAFGAAALHRKTVAIHSSTVTYNNKSILFLGESGTGKSTQSQLWLKYIPGTELLNDDSPFLSTDENNNLTVYGSPWSGKTPCYKNKQTPVAAFIRLRQASYNAIRRLSTLEAIGAVQPSLPPVFAADPVLSDFMYECLSSMLRHTPAYILDCLPDESAAKLVYTTLKEDGWI